MDLRVILFYLRPYRLHLLGAFLSLALITLAQLAVPGYIGVAVNEIIRSRSFAVLDRTALVVLGLFAARSAFVYAQVYLTFFLGHRTIADLRRDLFVRIQRWSIDRFAAWQSGDAISRTLLDTQLVQTHLLSGAVDTAATVLMLTGIVVALFYLEWRLALLVSAVIPLLLASARLFGKEIQRVAGWAQGHVAGLASSIREAFAGALVIRAFTQEEREIARFTAQNQRATQANLRISMLVATQVPVVSFLTSLGLVVVLWVGGRLVTGGTMTPGGLVAFLGYMALAIEPAVSLTRHYAEMRQALGAFARIRGLLDETEAVRDLPDAIDLEHVTGGVEFRNVSFQYANGQGGDQWVLRGVDLRLAPGERIALVGASGAGKTTLVHLLPRFYEPADGVILIDGIDIRRVRLRSLRQRIGIVPQETMLFRGTVRQNIAYARPQARPAEVEAAARAANAHEFITALPQGYDTLIGEDGATLSGGQRQRLAIARALLLDPRILILDEATSALDSESEALFQEALDRAMEGRTTITIAHRLSTVRKAHRIVVLDEGRVAEEGSHEDLLRRGGLYARLARLQWPGLGDVPRGGAEARG
jgi:subfamily B ATP-binding cassette protein MsbA